MKVRPQFVRGDLVQIAAKMPSCMSHFSGNQQAIVSEFDECQGQVEYAVYLMKDRVLTAWYPESLLTLVKKRCMRYLNILDRVDCE